MVEKPVFKDNISLEVPFHILVGLRSCLIVRHTLFFLVFKFSFSNISWFVLLAITTYESEIATQTVLSIRTNTKNSCRWTFSLQNNFIAFLTGPSVKGWILLTLFSLAVKIKQFSKRFPLTVAQHHFSMGCSFKINNPTNPYIFPGFEIVNTEKLKPLNSLWEEVENASLPEQLLLTDGL